MVESMCQLDWAKGVLGVSVRMFLEEVRIWTTGVRRDHTHHCGGHHPIHSRPE